MLKGKRHTRKHFRCGQSKTKKIVSKEITEDCGKGGLFKRNYLNYESIINTFTKNLTPRISIDTTRY